VNRRDFILRGAALAATIPFGVSALLREPEEEFNEEFIELLGEFTTNIHYTVEPFNDMLNAIRELQDVFLKLASTVHGQA